MEGKIMLDIEYYKEVLTKNNISFENFEDILNYFKNDLRKIGIDPDIHEIVLVSNSKMRVMEENDYE